LPALWLQEIRDKYPPWLAAHEGGAGGVTPSDLARYKQQYASICALVDMYESQPDNFQGILQHLQEVGGWMGVLGWFLVDNTQAARQL
jgi:hypothetical protein